MVVVVEEEVVEPPNSGVTLLQVFPEEREEVEEVGKQGKVCWKLVEVGEGQACRAELVLLAAHWGAPMGVLLLDNQADLKHDCLLWHCHSMGLETLEEALVLQAAAQPCQPSCLFGQPVSAWESHLRTSPPTMVEHHFCWLLGHLHLC